ncbi:MAG TPA: hypothetical protein VL068_11410, partial [Microthrixaceae bacterium]|nr:hypothetical protein [Microthrixaceae bacterium]
TANRQARVYDFLHDARPVLFNFGAAGTIDVSPWLGRLRLVEAKYEGIWELPVLGEVAAPSAVLIRPDGHVVWVRTSMRLDQLGLREIVEKWFGVGEPATRRL